MKHADFIVTCDDENRIIKDADLLVKDGLIACVGKTDEKADEEIDCRGMIMYPGLVNTHHHLYQTFSRNLPEVQNLELFDWLKYLYEIWKNLDFETVYMSALTGIGELLLTGCTTVMDHHYVFPEGTGHELLMAQFEAADLLGARLYATRGSMDLSVKDGGLPPDSVVQSVDGILKDSEKAVAAFHDPSFASMHRVALAPCSPFSVSRELLVESQKLARSLKVRLHTHLAETKDEERYTLERYGMRPLSYMETVGWTGPDVWYAHGIHFTDDELLRLQETGTGVAHCPQSNMKLSSGVARISAMLKKGVKVGLAVDGSASNDGSSLLEEMRTAFLLHRLYEGREAPSGYDILKMATRGSASLLGMEGEIGALAAGRSADFFLIRRDRLCCTGALSDPGAYLSTVGFRGNVDMTVVRGRVVVREGRLTGIDEEKAARQAADVCRRYLDKF